MIVLSSSAISAYIRCQYAYALGYVYRLRGRQNMAAAIGVAVHAGVEALFVGHEDPAEALARAFHGEVASVPIEDRERDPEAFLDANRMLRIYTEEVAPTFRPTLVEAPFAFQLNGTIISGIIDAADGDDLRDLKTTAGKTINGRAPSFTPASYDLQLSLYALGYKILTGKMPRRLLLDVVTRRGTYRQYERAPQIGEALDVVGVVRDGIERGDFEPTGLHNGACAWCSHASQCKYVGE